MVSPSLPVLAVPVYSMHPLCHGTRSTTLAAFTSPCPLPIQSDLGLTSSQQSSAAPPRRHHHHQHPHDHSFSRRLRRRPRRRPLTTPGADWTMCAPPGTPQKRDRSIPNYLDIERDNPLLTRVGQIEELKRAARSRKRGNWRFAAAILNAIHEYVDGTTAFLNESLHVRSDELFAESPDISATEVFDDMMSIINESYAPQSVITFNAVLVALQKRISGKYHVAEDALDAALRVLDLMNRRHIIPDDYSFSVLYGMCATAGNYRYLAVFERNATDVEQKRQNRQQQSKSSKSAPGDAHSQPRHPRFGGPVACSSLVCARAKLGLLKEADELFNEMRDHQVKASERTYACLIGAFQRERQHARVVSLWSVATSEQAVTGPHIFSGVIASCCRAEDCETAYSAVEWMLYKRRKTPRRTQSGSEAKSESDDDDDISVESRRDVSLPNLDDPSLHPPVTNASSILGTACLDLVFNLAVRCADLSLAERIVFDWGFHDADYVMSSVHGARLLSCVGQQLHPVQGGRRNKSVAPSSSPSSLPLSSDQVHVQAQAVKYVWDVIDRFHFVLCIDEDVVLLNAAADTLVRLGRPQDARDVVLKRMPYRNVTPNDGSYKSLIRAYAKLGDMKAVVNVIRIMKTQGLPLDSSIYNAVFHAAQMCGDTKVADLALSAMRKVEGRAQMAEGGDGVVQSSNKKEEERVKQDMGDERRQQVGGTVRGQKRKQISVDQMTDVSLLLAMRRESNVEGVLQFHATAARNGRVVDDKASGLVLSTLLDNNCVTEAISVFAWLVVHGRAGLTCYNVIIHQFGQRKSMEVMSFNDDDGDSDDDDDDDDGDIVNNKRSPTPIHSKTDIEDGSNSGIQDDGYTIAERVFQAMKQKRRGIMPADEVTYTGMVRACCTHGRLDRAFRLLAEVQDVGVGMSDTHVWSAVIDGCGRLGQWERGVELLHMMRAATSSRDNGGSRGIDTEVSGNRTVMIPRPTIVCYNAALYAAGVHGRDWEAVVQLFHTLLDDCEAQQQNMKKRRALSSAHTVVVPNVVTFSAMASAILKCRLSITAGDLGVVQLVIDRLREFESAPKKPDMRRGEQPNKDRDRARDAVARKKITTKIGRLEWIIRVTKLNGRGDADRLEQ